MNPVPHILLAEDDACLSRLLLRTLGNLDPAPKVVHVADGEQALDRLHLRRKTYRRALSPPSVVVLDLNMPKIGGLEVLRRIRGNARLRLLPVVMFTSSENEHDLRACYESGANACVVKPIGFQELSHVIRQLGIFWTQVNQMPPPEPKLAGRPALAIG